MSGEEDQSEPPSSPPETTFKPDEDRGKWGSKFDFYLTSIGHTFGVQTFCIISNIGILSGGVIQFFPLILNILTLAIPMYFIQSFMGQFSSTGCISVFRISPLFKGIGYATLILNIASVTYCSVLAAYQLLYLISAIQLELPWAKCNHAWNTPNCSEAFDLTSNLTFGNIGFSAGAEYFGALTKSNLDTDSTSMYSGFSLAVFGATAIVWSLSLAIILSGVKSIGKIIRSSTILCLFIFLIITLRTMFLPGAISRFGKTLIVDMNILATPTPWIFSPMIVAMIFGSGWSTALTLSSYNTFKTNVQKYSIIIPFFMIGLIFLASIMVSSILAFIQGLNDVKGVNFGEENLEFPFLVFTYFVTKVEIPQLWATMFFLMLFLLELNSVIVQILTVTTAFFDEFAQIRGHRTSITFGICVFAFILASVFAKEDGYILFYQLVYFGVFSKLGIAFFELMVYLWMYGRKRLIRDIRFMLGEKFGLWKFYFLRFVTPPMLLIATFFSIFISVIALKGSMGTISIILLMKMLPWLFIPIYGVYELYRAKGSLVERLDKCCNPCDWGPIDCSVREEYEEETLRLHEPDEASTSDVEAQEEPNESEEPTPV